MLCKIYLFHACCENFIHIFPCMLCEIYLFPNILCKIHICIPLHFVRNLNISLHAGLGIAFFCVRHATFFCVLLKNATFFFAFFSNFWRLMKLKRMLRSFAFFLKECAFFQKNPHSFQKKELKCFFSNFLRLLKPKKNTCFF